MFEDISALKYLMICSECIGDPFIAIQIEKTAQNDECHHCFETSPIMTLGEVAELVDQAFEVHYERTSQDMTSLEYAMHKDKELSYDWEREGERPEYIIADQVGVDADTALNIKKILAEKHFDFEMAKMGEETEFSGESQYEPKRVDSYGLYDEWRNFRDNVEKEARYFSNSAKEFLDSIFGDVEDLKTREGDYVIQTINPGDDLSIFFRGRTFQSEKKVEEAMVRPDRDIGPAPSGLAAAGRMNAKGISVFYGATHPDIALSELRPPVGSSVVMGEFHLVRPIRLLNLSLLSKVVARGSIFDPNFTELESRSHFLTSLVRIMTRPTNPDLADKEYLPTQLIAEYIANAHPSEIDGILFSSSQSEEAGFNVVLFRHASKVEPLIIDPRSEINTSTYEQYADDEIEIHYSVTEWVEDEIVNNTKDLIPEDDDIFEDVDGPIILPDISYQSDPRSPFLKINLDNLVVRQIKASKFTSDDYKVSHQTYKKSELRGLPF